MKKQKLSLEAEEFRSVVSQAVDEICSLEIVLDKTTKSYVQALKDRQQLINQWTRSVNALQQRDKGINDIINEIENLRETAKTKVEKFRENEQFLSIQLSNNREIEEAIKQLDKILSYSKEEQQKLGETIETYTTQVIQLYFNYFNKINLNWKFKNNFDFLCVIVAHQEGEFKRNYQRQ